MIDSLIALSLFSLEVRDKNFNIFSALKIYIHISILFQISLLETGHKNLRFLFLLSKLGKGI